MSASNKNHAGKEPVFAVSWVHVMEALMLSRLKDSLKLNADEVAHEVAQWRRWGWGECVALLSLFSLSLLVGMTHLATDAKREPYLLKYYGPAVMVALEQGFQNPDVGHSPVIKDFLDLKKERIEQDQYPGVVRSTGLAQFQRIHRYAMVTMGAFWWLLGLSWHSQDLLHALLFAVACLFAYGLFRLAARRWIAVLFSLCIVFSPLMLHVLPQFRDFSKAPFVLGTIFICAFVATKPLNKWQLCGAAAVLGSLLGLGLGFRQDMLVYCPAGLLVFLVLAPGAYRKTWRRRAVACAILVSIFLATGHPILKAMRGGTNGAHNIALGMTRSYDERLGVGRVPYKVSHLYRDAYMHTRISAHAMDYHGQESSVPYWSGEYEHVGRSFLLDVYRTFPADFLTRWYAAVRQILNYGPFAWEAFYSTNDQVDTLFDWRFHIFRLFVGWGVFLALATVVLLAALNLRWALTFIFLVLYFGGYTSLQFHLRHYFPFEVFFFWTLAFLLNTLVTCLLAVLLRKDREQLFGWWSHRGGLRQVGCRFAAAACVALFVLGGSMAVCQVWQYWSVGRLYEHYAEALRRPLELEIADAGNMSVLRPKRFLQPEEATSLHRKNRVQSGLLAIEIAPSPHAFSVTLRYAADSKLNDFGDSVRIPSASKDDRGPRFLFFPIFNTTDPYFGAGERCFEGVAVPSAHESLIKNMYAVEDLKSLPLSLTLLISSNRDRMAWRMRLLPKAVPKDVRSRQAFYHNLFQNGSFERWDGTGSTPLLTAVPKGSFEIAREELCVSDGIYAVRQTWDEPRQEEGLFSRFGVFLEDIPPGREYEVFLKAWNQGEHSVFFEVHQAVQDTSSQSHFTLISPAQNQVGSSKGYKEYSVRVHVAKPPQGKVNLVVSTGSAASATVLWDAFRIVPALSGP